MVRTNIALACIAALLAAGTTGCGQDAAPASRAVQQAQELTRASFQTFGDHVVHFNAQSTTMLPPEVARAFGIRRSGNRAMLNITVLRRGEAHSDTPVTADIMVDTGNLLGQHTDVSMRELREGGAIYYVGEFSVANTEVITFRISVRPEGAGTPHEFSFRQQFYTD
jgi:hypothetical protein